MSWFDPPPLVKKPRPTELVRLPPGINLARLRLLALVGALAGGLGAALATLGLLIILESTFSIPPVIRSAAVPVMGVLGALTGVMLVARAVCLAANAYVRAQNTASVPEPPQV